MVDSEDGVARLHRSVTTTITATCVVVVILNILSAPPDVVERGILAVMLAPPVLGIALLAAFSLLASRSVTLRWVEVIALILVGLLATLTAPTPQLTSFFYGTTGIALAAEYGYLRRWATLKLGIWAGAYVAALAVSAVGGSSSGWLRAGLTITAAVSVCLIVWFVVQARLRFHERREEELNAIVAERTKELNESLEAQTALLSEIHHRTKNNLQLVSSMLSFIERTAESTIPEMVEAARGRLLALARVHELLYNETSAGSTHLGVYLNEYVAELSSIFLATSCTVKADIEARQDVPLDTAVRVSLVVNEIAMMAMERAVLSRKGSVLHLHARTDQGLLTLSAHEEDTMQPVSEDFTHTLGTQIVEALVETLGGTWDVHSDHDVEWRIVIPLTGAQSLPTKTRP
ncbi:MAG: sensor histidine kinase [Spirochaetota bacterium]